MSNPKRHHYLPQFYLEGFTRNGMLCVFDREKNEYRNQRPKDTAVIRHLYTWTDESGEKHYDLEQMLSLVEGRAKLVIQAIEKGANPSPLQRCHLAWFLALLACRVP